MGILMQVSGWLGTAFAIILCAWLLRKLVRTRINIFSAIWSNIAASFVVLAGTGFFDDQGLLVDRVASIRIEEPAGGVMISTIFALALSLIAAIKPKQPKSEKEI